MHHLTWSLVHFSSSSLSKQASPSVVPHSPSGENKDQPKAAQHHQVSSMSPRPSDKRAGAHVHDMLRQTFSRLKVTPTWLPHHHHQEGKLVQGALFRKKEERGGARTLIHPSTSHPAELTPKLQSKVEDPCGPSNGDRSSNISEKEHPLSLSHTTEG